MSSNNPLKTGADSGAPNPSGRNCAGRFAIIRQLIADGIHCMFGNPGSSEENLLDALGSPEFSTFRYYLALHEGTAVAMADAFARATRRPSVVQLHSYAGLANGLGMMYYARRGYTPLVVLAGEAGLKFEALDGQMSADLLSMARPFVKSDHNGPCAWRANDSNSLLRLVKRAIKSAATAPMGPVFLALPMDVLEEVNTELPIATSSVRTDVAPDSELLSKAADWLLKSKTPLLLVGDGIAASEAQSELTTLAELIGAKVCGANNSEVNMAASHPLYIGSLGHMYGDASIDKTKAVLKTADVVLVCGTTVLPDVFSEIGSVFAADARVIQFDLNSYEIAKNYHVDLAGIGNPKTTLGLLAQCVSRKLTPESQQTAKDRLAQSLRLKDRQLAEHRASDDEIRKAGQFHASTFFQILKERLPENSIIFDEALTHSPELCRYLPQDRAGYYFQTRAGMLGTGLPGTLGLKLAMPDSVVIGFTGDGGAMSTIQALATAARHNIGAKFVILNNRSYRILKQNIQVYRSQTGQPCDKYPVEFDLVPPDLRFDLLAQAQGVTGMRVSSESQAEEALSRAFADDAPFLLDVVVDGTP